MEIEQLKVEFTVCKVSSSNEVSLCDEFLFFSKTDEELSLICPTASVPQNTLQREDGWTAFRLSGAFDFSMVGILAKLSAVLADVGISLLTVATFNTDYFFVKTTCIKKAISALETAGYTIK